MGTGATKTQLKMGTRYTLGGDREDWLWNVAKRALPEGASNADVLRYMKLIAEKNGVQLDAKNDVVNTPANRAKVAQGKPLELPDYVAPKLEDIQSGKAELAPYMHGDSVKELKKMLNAATKSKLNVDDDTYDAETKAAYDHFRATQNLPPRKDGVVNTKALAALRTSSESPDKLDSKDPKDTTIRNAPTEADKNGKRTYYDPTQGKLVTVNGKTPAKETEKEKEKKPAATLDELEETEQFKSMAPDQKRDVRRAMNDAEPDVQQRIAGLASDPKFKLLSAAIRKQVLELAENKDENMQKALQMIVGSDKFHGADNKVKLSVIDLLTADAKTAPEVMKILDSNGTTDEKMKALSEIALDQ